MPKKPDPRRIKTHRIYTPHEAAEPLGLHVETVRRWIKDGRLVAETSRKPWLIEGADLKVFLQTRRDEGRCRLRSEQIYCLPCRGPMIPDGQIADFRLLTPATGMLVGLCPGCGRVMQKCLSRADLEAVRTHLEVTVQKAQPRIVGEVSASATVNSGEVADAHGKTQLG